METIPTEESISLFFHPNTNLVFTAVNQGIMILLFLNEVHMDKSEYNYLRGMGNFSSTISFFLFYFWQCSIMFSKKLGKQQDRWCLVKKNLEVQWSKGWRVALKINPCLLNIRNKRVFINCSHCSFVFAHIIHHFGRHQDRIDSSRWFDSWSDAVESIAATLGEKLYSVITTREKRTGKPWAEARTHKQTAAKSYKSWNANPMIFNAVKVLMEERITYNKSKGRESLC